MQNYLETVISQYGNSQTLLALIENFNTYIDPAVDFEAFYENIWNLDTATGVGLDIWGRIVGVNRVITFTGTQTYFGFQDGVNDYAPFGQAPFYGGPAITTNYTLSDTAYRTLILVKAAANIAATVAPTLNSLMRSLFAGRGRAYVCDLGFMKMLYTFEFYLQPFELAVLTLCRTGTMPKPTGVQVSVLQVPVGSTFGFAEAGYSAEPFGFGTFLANGATIAS